MQRVDRELSLELIESPINPAFLNISSPLVGGYDPLFYVQIHGEALWQWRNLQTHDQVFNNHQDGLMKFGYKLSSSSCPRVGTAVYRRVQYLAKKARNINNSDSIWKRVCEASDPPVALLRMNLRSSHFFLRSLFS